MNLFQYEGLTEEVVENAERRADLLAYIREFDLVPQSIFTLSFHLFIDALGEYAPGTLILSRR